MKRLRTTTTTATTTTPPMARCRYLTDLGRIFGGSRSGALFALVTLAAFAVSEIRCSSSHGHKPMRLYAGFTYTETSNEPTYNIFCYPARPYTPFGVFASAHLQFRLRPASYELYESENATDVAERSSGAQRTWFPLLLLRNYIPFAPFSTKCIGIDTASEYQFTFSTRRVDFLRLLQCVLSLALFFNARRLVRSPAVFYSSGAAIGVVASLLLIVIFVKRMLPGGRLSWAAFILTGWSFWVYTLIWLWGDLYKILVNYKNYLLAYIGLSAGIAFLICYRWGPPKEERTIDTLQLIMQFFALCGVYFSSDIPEVTLAFCICAIVFYNVPDKLKSRVRTWFRRRFFRPKIILLTEEEYVRQGDEMTALELEKLRQFAQSPDCQAWKVMSRLKNPGRFGSFVMGESHLQDSEILEYETSGTRLFDDDEDEEDDDSDNNGRSAAVQRSNMSTNTDYNRANDTDDDDDDEDNENFSNANGPGRVRRNALLPPDGLRGAARWLSAFSSSSARSIGTNGDTAHHSRHQYRT